MKYKKSHLVLNHCVPTLEEKPPRWDLVSDEVRISSRVPPWGIYHE